MASSWDVDGSSLDCAYTPGEPSRYSNKILHEILWITRLNASTKPVYQQKPPLKTLRKTSENKHIVDTAAKAAASARQLYFGYHC